MGETVMPGDWLLRIAKVLFDQSIVASVIVPTIADLRQEVFDAATSSARVSAHLHGYLAFWTIVLMSPFAFNNWPGRPQRVRGMVLLTIVTAAVGVVILLRPTEWIFHSLGHVFADNLPPDAYAVFGWLNPFAFLAGPLAIGLVLLRRRLSGAMLWRIGPAEVMLFGLVSVCLGAVLSAAGVVGTFVSIGRTGTAGFPIVSAGIRQAMEPTVYAAIAAVVCLVAAAWLSARERRVPASATEPMSVRSAIALSVLVFVSLGAVDQLVRLQHEANYWALALLSPPGPGTGGMQVAQASDRTFPILMIWGTLLTFVLLLSATVVWRASRAHVLHPIFLWCSRLGLAAALVGTVWHATVANWYVNTFEDNFEKARAGQMTQPSRR